jgi:D-alanyl-D-alanine carboxypeptidase/D-alanyl-D-alanine-endopeptidase (penicillin-binding protein 4)
VEQRFLIDSVRIDSTSFALADGSGLSTANLVTPLALARLLHHMRRHPRYPVFAAGLPRAGGPGSLRTRFAGTPLAGRVRAKTGSIARSNALSGYLELEGGRVLSFAVLANNHAEPNQAMLDAIDSVVVTIGREVTGRR